MKCIKKLIFIYCFLALFFSFYCSAENSDGSVGVVPNSLVNKEMENKDNSNVELHFSGTISKIVHECDLDGDCVMYIDDIIVSFGKLQNGHSVIGKVFWPTRTPRRDYLQMVGKRADVYCLKKFESKLDGKYTVCSIVGKKEYFIKIHQ
jgi:hypothetical protein